MANEISDESNQNLSEDETQDTNGNENDEEEDESQFDDPEGFVDSISDNGRFEKIFLRAPWLFVKATCV